MAPDANDEPEVELPPDLPRLTIPPPPELSPLSEAVLAHLRRLPGTLFGLVDGARSSRIVPMLEAGDAPYESLYAGEKGKRLAPVGPYLVEFSRPSPLLVDLVEDGWGDAWGVFLTSEHPFREVRRSLRRFLQVELPGGRRVFFRFYDPRVLRAYLPSCTPEEALEFLGPIERFVVEGKEREVVVEFVRGPDGVEPAQSRLSGPT